MAGLKGADPLVWCRIPGTYMGKDLDRGQVVSKLNSPRDERLKDLGYINDLDPSVSLFHCDECGSDFTEDVWRRGHVEKRHLKRVKSFPPRQSDETEMEYHERVTAWLAIQDEQEFRTEERAISKMAPHVENSLASRS